MKAKFILYSITLFFALWGLTCNAAGNNKPPRPPEGKGKGSQKVPGRGMSHHTPSQRTLIKHTQATGRRNIQQHLGPETASGDVFKPPEVDKTSSEGGFYYW